MLKVDNLSYAYSDKYLFENLGFHLDIKTIIIIGIVVCISCSINWKL